MTEIVKKAILSRAFNVTLIIARVSPANNTQTHITGFPSIVAGICISIVKSAFNWFYF